MCAAFPPSPFPSSHPEPGVPELIIPEAEKCTSLLLSHPLYKHARSISVFLSMPLREIDTTQIVHDALTSGKSVYIPYILPPPPAVPSTSLQAGPGVMDMLHLRSLSDLASLKPDSWGIPTLPKEGLEARKNAIEEARQGRGKVDLVVMPGLGFDEVGGRIGHGKGYYDFWVQRYREAVREREEEIDGVGIVMGLGVEGEGGKDGPGGGGLGGKAWGKDKGTKLVALALKEQVLGEGQRVPRDRLDWGMDLVCVGDGRLMEGSGEEGRGSGDANLLLV